MTTSADATYITKVHDANQGDALVVESGGEIGVLSGGTLELKTGSSLKAGSATLAPADLATLAGTAAAGEATIHIAKVALAALDTAGGVFAWANPQAGTIEVTRVDIYITTKSTGACTIDVGVTAVSAATKDDTLLDGIDVGTATGILTLVDQAGANGKNRQLLATGKWVTASMDSGAAAGLIGSAYIHYVVL
jgi:hypothetical protein